MSHSVVGTLCYFQWLLRTQRHGQRAVKKKRGRLSCVTQALLDCNTLLQHDCNTLLQHEKSCKWQSGLTPCGPSNSCAGGVLFLWACKQYVLCRTQTNRISQCCKVVGEEL